MKLVPIALTLIIVGVGGWGTRTIGYGPPLYFKGPLHSHYIPVHACRGPYLFPLPARPFMKFTFQTPTIRWGGRGIGTSVSNGGLDKIIHITRAHPRIS